MIKQKPENEADILSVISESLYHMKVLSAVQTLDLPEVWVAAGFVRNYVWDVMHGYESMTPLNDIDVIYFDHDNHDEAFEKSMEQKLNEIEPGLPWSVKNQARMYIKNGDAPYNDNADALSRWCETVTPIGVRLTENDNLELFAPLGVGDLLSLTCHATPHAKSRPDKLSDYRERMQEKKWWEIWPNVKVNDLD